MGITPVEHIIQLNDMNNELRTGLWNVLTINDFDKEGFYYLSNGRKGRLWWFSEKLWAKYFKLPVDTIPGRSDSILEYIRQYFFNCCWFEVYDFIEFFVNEYKPELIVPINDILEREMSGYRVIDGQVAPITSREEIQSIQDAIDEQIFPGVSIHIRKALEMLSNKTSPDYRNSIKESISAVESACCSIAGSSSVTLGDALTIFKKKQAMHGALIEGLKKLYGYTNDADGIRHAMLEEPSLTQADAIYFLVSCSAFINYLKSKQQVC